MSKTGPFRDGRVHVLRDKCPTCIFRPGNLMELHPGRLADIVDQATRADSAITCHSTMDGSAPAVCRGFFDAYSTTPLQVAERLGLLVEDEFSVG